MGVCVYSHPVLLGVGGVPSSSPNRGRVPTFSPNGAIGVPPIQSWWQDTPSSPNRGVPLAARWGVTPISITRWGYPPSQEGWRYHPMSGRMRLPPPQVRKDGVTPCQQDGGTPLPPYRVWTDKLKIVPSPILPMRAVIIFIPWKNRKPIRVNFKIFSNWMRDLDRASNGISFEK